MTLPASPILTGVTLLVASSLHSAAGFAFALLAIPILLFLGWAPYQAIALCAVSLIVHGLLSVGRAPERPDWRRLAGLVAIGAAAQPVGCWILGQLVFLGRERIAQVFGGIVLALLAVKLLVKPQPRDNLPPGWGVLTMVASGIISGLSGMGGPPVVLWTIAHRWSNERIRVTLWTIFTAMAVTNLGWLTWRFGRPVFEATLIGLLFAPVTLLGTIPGSWVGAKMSPAAMRRVATVILVVVAAYALLQPAIGNLGTGR
ncbi:sulfite exporter TauE/SafE family protein [bacterium]|nr:sulfite exporter TauE/SafE family protein [bacterium]